MEFLALVYGDPDAWERLSEDERAAAYEGYMAVSRDATAAGALVDASELESTAAATSVRVRDGEALVTDGPYAEVKESLGGYYLFSCDSIEDAIAWAARIPAAWTRRRDRGAARPRRGGGGSMKYAMLVYSDQSSWESLSDGGGRTAPRAESMPRWIALFEEFGKADPNVAGPRARRGVARRRSSASSTARRSSPTARSPRRRSSSAASSSPTSPTSTRRSGSPRSSPPRSTAPSRSGRSSSGERAARRGLCRRVAAVRRDPDPRPRRSRARRGRGAGCLHDRARAVAADGHPGQSGRLDRHHCPQPGDRPDPA